MGTVSDDERIERALVVTAHPDDVDFLASGTVARWVAAGTAVTYCVLTDGDAGGFDPDTPRTRIPALRRQEQVRAAKAVGVDDVRFLGYADGSVAVTPELRRDISRVIRQVRPQRVVMHSPEINWAQLPDFHPDHRAAGEATLQAVYPDARNPFAHPLLLEESLEPWSVPQIWMVGAPRPDHWVDVTEEFATKLLALRAHASQTAHLGDLEQMIRARLESQARHGGLAPGRLAEAFQVVSTA
jgi:LmbE family N-acetylglucosaminyl deacetylase